MMLLLSNLIFSNPSVPEGRKNAMESIVISMLVIFIVVRFSYIMMRKILKKRKAKTDHLAEPISSATSLTTGQQVISMSVR
jgi:uncharacterized protein YpmB